MSTCIYRLTRTQGTSASVSDMSVSVLYSYSIAQLTDAVVDYPASTCDSGDLIPDYSDWEMDNSCAKSSFDDSGSGT